MNNRILLITGGSSEIGRELIRQCSDEYDLIWVHCNSSSELLSSLKETLGEKIRIIQADFSNPYDIDSMLKEIDESKCIPTGLVHLAAPKVTNANYHKRSWDEYQQNIDVSVRSAEKIIRYLIPNMSANRFGRIVFALSSSTLDGKVIKYQTPYIVGKYALLGMMESLSKEYADKGITVNGFSPDMTETRFLSEIPKIVIERNARDNPLGRNIALNDIIPCIKYLLSDAAGAVTGQNIGITGGK